MWGKHELHVQGSWCSYHPTSTMCACELYPRLPAPTLRRCQSMLRCVCQNKEWSSYFVLPQCSYECTLVSVIGTAKSVMFFKWRTK